MHIMDIDCYVTMPHSLKRVNISVNIQSTERIEPTPLTYPLSFGPLHSKKCHWDWWGGGQTEGHACPDVWLRTPISVSGIFVRFLDDLWIKGSSSTKAYRFMISISTCWYIAIFTFSFDIGSKCYAYKLDMVHICTLSCGGP